MRVFFVQALLKNSNCFVVIETDHNSDVAESVVKAGMEVEDNEEEEEEQMPEGVYGENRTLALFHFERLHKHTYLG